MENSSDAKPKLKILIVDDDQFLLNMYGMKFTKEGADVTTANGSAAALEKLKNGFLPDIMLLDIVMPGMDGLELLGEIRNLKLAPNSVIIMLTNQSSNAEIQKAESYGIAGYIVKATTIPSEVVTDVMSIYKTKHP